MLPGKSEIRLLGSCSVSSHNRRKSNTARWCRIPAPKPQNVTVVVLFPLL